MRRGDGGDGRPAKVSIPAQPSVRLTDATRGRARGNLAAMLCTEQGIEPENPAGSSPESIMRAAEDFAMICAALGLGDVPIRAPGTCPVCSKAISISEAGGYGRSTRTRLGHTCSKACAAAVRAGDPRW